jgi:hypothetical protein
MKWCRQFAGVGVVWLMVLGLGACSYSQSAQPEKTQLEIRQFQTRDFENKNFKMVMKAMLSVLQDENYMVKNANLELGLLSASKDEEISSRSSDRPFWNIMLGSQTGAQAQVPQTYDKTKTTECTANLSTFGKLTRVRVTFTQKTINNVKSFFVIAVCKPKLINNRM